jgi:hypothetical protein
VDMRTIGGADRLRFPHLPSKLGRRGKARLRPMPTGTSSNKNLEIEDVGITLRPASTLMPSIGPAP